MHFEKCTRLSSKVISNFHLEICPMYQKKTAPFLSLKRSNHSTKLWPNLHYSINYAYTLLKQETSSFARKKN